MGMVVQHNMNALNAYNRLNTNVSGLKKASEKLSSGYRINRAGDDAAGLAISEKMRSQIRGLNQAKRNAQDGISMIQTYEGAAQESHSILQRMKELASEAANGTYQNEVDRDAIQLEFDQLNDELDQIADTDFNGVVMLNGGQMADGTRAVDGKFDYVNSTNNSTIAEAAVDISGDQAGTLVDNSTYNKAVADDIWKTIGLDVNKTENVNITFTFDGEKWNATSASDASGKLMDNVDVSALSTTRSERNAATGDGGFAINAGNSSVNVIFDEMNTDGNNSIVKEGDTVTVNFTNTKAKTYAPDNAGIAESSVSTTVAALKNKVTPKFKLDSSITDATMDADTKTALDALVAADITATYAGGEATVSATGFTIDTDGTVTHDATSKVLGKITINDVTADTPEVQATANGTLAAGGTLTTTIDDQDILNTMATADAKLTYDGTDSTWKDGDDNAVDLADYGLSIDGNAADGDTIDITAYVAAQTNVPDPNVNGAVNFKINVDAYNVADLTNVTATSVATPDDAKMVASVNASGVSQANSNDAATAPLTYTDHLVLQTGARTKDSVDFTFSYKTEGMGDLKANMNISSRADGLGTKNLSLNTQEAANAAIDKIDNAINKVSMVRATFGATQNRLEHKVENLTTTSENLTEAESGIRDTDMASEMLNYTKFNVLQQAAQSMLAQANQQPQSILQLLG